MSGETKAAAEGDLAVAIKAINEDVTADFEAETTSRGEELRPWPWPRMLSITTLVAPPAS